MGSHQLVDAQFNRAVEIIQSLPKTGPIQTGYEEKLNMYSLYKQATVGNVTTARPGIFDMLGRAKWDAWAKHRDLDPYEAKALYVDALLKALSKYSDKTIARDLIDELRSYGGGSENLVSSYTLTRTGSRGSSSSTSTASEDNVAASLSHGQHTVHPLASQHFSPIPGGESSDDGEAADESRDLLRDIPQQQRSISSISFSSRYKTPLTGSFTPSSPPPRRTSVPPSQPLPYYETPSAFADYPQRTPVTNPSAFIHSTYAASLSSSRDSAPPIHSTASSYRTHPITSRQSTTATAHPRPPSRAASISLEHAMENMQAHLAALTERVDTLELSLANHSQPPSQNSPLHTSSGRGSPASSRPVHHQPFEWDINDLGLWTLVLKPLSRNLSFLQRLLLFFFTSSQDRSPLQIVVRRLCLDISFLMVVVGVLRTAWRRSGARRKEVGAALVVLWRAVTGKNGIPVGRNLRL